MSRWNQRKNKVHGSTQGFLDFTDVRQGLIELTSTEYAMALDVSAINFDLKSSEEKAAVVAGYRDFLNSLHFPIQIVARSEMLRLDGYLSMLKEREDIETSDVMKEQLAEYRHFVRELIANRNILARRYYLVLRWFAPSRKGAQVDGWLKEALRHLSDRRVTVENGLRRVGLSVRPLTDDELLALLKKSYGGHQNQTFNTATKDYLTLRVVTKS